MFATLNKEEYFRFYNEKISHCFADFKCKNIIIEFDAVYWHKDKTEHDNIKTELLEKAGYKVLRLTDTECDKFPKESVEKAIKFIKDNIC